MKITQIDEICEFDKIRTDWDQVYAADPNAHIFVSWMWLRKWFEVTPYPWFVLAVQPDDRSPYVAFFPLIRRDASRLVRVLYMGGRPFAFYTGFICVPEYESEALAALTSYLQQQVSWDRFQLENVADPRLEKFLNHFPDSKFETQPAQHYPYMAIPALPDSWEHYLQDFLGTKTRRNLRRSLRDIEVYRITQIQNNTVTTDIDVLLTLWQQRWGANPKIHWHHQMLHYLFEQNCLWLKIVWDGTIPVAARAGLMDEVKKTFYAYVVCYNPEYAKLSPGNAMVGDSIRYAIENGFQVYNFLTGEDDHKYSFGATKRMYTYTVISRKSLKSSIANGGLKLVRQARDYLKKQQ